MLYKIIIIGLGGFVGSTARYIISKLIQENVSSIFPWATLLINLIGSFLIGVLFTFSYRENLISENWSNFLIIGLCGGFTTFSTFSLENYNLYNAGNYLPLLLYSSISIIGGLIMVFLGIVVVKNF